MIPNWPTREIHYPDGPRTRDRLLEPFHPLQPNVLDAFISIRRTGLWSEGRKRVRAARWRLLLLGVMVFGAGYSVWKIWA